MTQTAARSLARALDELRDGELVVVTGAGISLASGIPTFRGTDKDAVWKRDVTELGTNRFFQSDPVGSWQWYTSRFDIVLDKLPNPAHLSLAGLERWHTAHGGRFVLVTQNVDTLHEDAGSEALIKVHGSSDRVRCTRHGCINGAPTGSLPRADIELEPFFADPSRETLPKCPECGSLLRQHVLWFDEFYDEHREYQWARVLRASRSMGMALFVGTSFAVGVTALFLEAGLHLGVPMFSVDPASGEAPHPRIESLREKAEELLPAVCAILEVELPPP